MVGQIITRLQRILVLKNNTCALTLYKKKHSMNIDKINCIIFENCNILFSELENKYFYNRRVNETFEMVAKSNDEGNLRLVKLSKDGDDDFYIQLYLEFLLNEELCKHPNFTISLDFVQKRAKVISFESNLSPHIRLDSFTEVNGQKYTNKVATYDITLLCNNWLKQLIDLEYKT